jgi:hypothetical protein
MVWHDGANRLPVTKRLRHTAVRLFEVVDSLDRSLTNPDIAATSTRKPFSAVLVRFTRAGVALKQSCTKTAPLLSPDRRSLARPVPSDRRPCAPGRPTIRSTGGPAGIPHKAGASGICSAPICARWEIQPTSTGCSWRNNTHGEGSLGRQTKSAVGSRPYGDRGHLGTSGMFAKER